MFKKKVAILTLVSVISSFSANTTAVLAHELTKNEEKISTQENSADNNEESKTAQNLETSQEEEKSQEQEKSQTEESKETSQDSQEESTESTESTITKKSESQRELTHGFFRYRFTINRYSGEARRKNNNLC